MRNVRGGVALLKSLAALMLSATLAEQLQSQRGTRQPVSLHAQSCQMQPATDSAALAAESAWVDALQHHRKDAIDCLLDPTFVDTDWRGTLRTRASVLAGMTAAPQQYSQRYGEFTLQRLGEIAVIRGLNTVSDSADHVVARVRFTDVLRYTAGHWAAVAAQETLMVTGSHSDQNPR